MPQCLMRRIAAVSGSLSACSSQAGKQHKTQPISAGCLASTSQQTLLPQNLGKKKNQTLLIRKKWFLPSVSTQFQICDPKAMLIHPHHTPPADAAPAVEAEQVRHSAF